ncbi:MAG: transcription-repair coupling factor [Planctomycetota bacterium]|jgi:transcription-repair coupling factor (superfamily II helicase)|nr:transcription-repair coupling factor [Planctomycetota bacterium]
MSLTLTSDNAWSGEFASALARGDLTVLGAKGSSLAKCLAGARGRIGRPLLLVAPDPEIAGDILNDLGFYLGDAAPPPLFWPAWDILPFETDRPDVEVAADQVEVLRSCLERPESLWIVAPITALLQPTLPPETIRAGGLSIAAGFAASPETLVARLVEGGLEPVAQVDAPGQFSRRGGIVDVFPMLGDAPFRIEFFGDEIETVRIFDPGNQRSGPPLAEPVVLVDVSRDSFSRIGGSPIGLADYLPPETAVILWHPERIARVAGLYAGGFSRPGSLRDFAEVAEKLSRHPLVAVPDIDGDPWPGPPWRDPAFPAAVNLGASGWERLTGGFDGAVRELGLLAGKAIRIVVACNNAGEERRLRQMLADADPALLERIDVRLGRLSRGFIRESASGGEAFVSDHELFGRLTPARSGRKRRFAGAPITDFAELRDGDYVVHMANGIARFEGMKTLEANGAEQDFLTLRFAEDARIYVPISHIDLVQRYIGLGGAAPQLSKLGSAAWAKRKETVERAVRDIAQDLLASQAKRLSSPGIALPPDDQMVREFDASFPYEETPDQLSADDDIRRNQQSEAPMERLLCGDVGFGKTEMAARAAFRTVNAGRQAAVLVPTTILAEQHYRTFSERMADYPVRVECLSRFRSQAEQEKIVEELRNGRIDVVIGTHRLLSGDVGFKDLGLVVIDEEQKFGVESKERMKNFRNGVDILTMTATPIPRTLHMSLLGLRDISSLATAPRERHSVKTIVARRTWEVIRRAVLREISRGGQCFFLHNRVHNIDELTAKLREVVPEARFGIGHGQMGEGELLAVMRGFLDGKIDVLVCTTIIESGVDIPNVNTLFVNEADHFGLSELHQLRGRVGRYKHQAYAYFLVPEKRPVSPEAAKRLQALQEYGELGSGFRIAMRDLEIRGAGNLLGLEQSGHIHLIGFDLYCRLLEKAVAAEKGVPLENDDRAELDIGSRAFIPPEYIPTEAQRIEFYRRLNRIRNLEQLAELRNYVRDRYGRPPAPVERCFRDQELRIRMLAAGVEALGRLDGALAATFSEKAAGRGIALLRHAGFKVDNLRDRQWRIEAAGLPAGAAEDEAAGMADRLIKTLESGRPALAAGRKRPAAKPAKHKPEPGATAPEPSGKKEPAAEPGGEVEASRVPAGAPSASAPANPPPADQPPPFHAPAETHLAFFSSDMLDAGTKAASLAARQESEAEPARKAGRVKGKSGAAAKAKREALLAAREGMPPGGVLKTARPPGPPGKTRNVSLGWPSAETAVGPPLPAPSPPSGRDDAGDDIFAELLDSSAGVRVLGMEPAIAAGQIGVVVPETAFSPIRFETMTLVIKSDPEERFFLRCVGSGLSQGRRVVLRLKTSGPGEASRAAEAYLAAGEALLFDGVAE